MAALCTVIFNLYTIEIMGIEKDGYLPPRDVVFNEIIKKCGLVWLDQFKDSDPRYLMEKLERLAYIKNEGADVMFALAMFHPILRAHVIHNLSDEAKDFINYYNKVNEDEGSYSEGDSR